MKKFIRSFWLNIHYRNRRITNRSQNLYGTDLERHRLSGDQERVLRESCLPYPKHKKDRFE